MSDYDAIVIGAGHNGLTAAAVMARGGLRVLCLEKNHFIGGMASTTELIRGYRFEFAGSIQFPVPNEVYEDLELASCPIYEPEVQSASVGEGDGSLILLYSDPEKLLEHLGETLGIEAVLGMAEVAAWAEAPACAIGRFDVRQPPKSLDEMWASATNETEREAIRLAMFGSVMDVVDRYLPDPVKHAPVRSMLAFLAVNSTYRGPYTPGSALCLAFALASPGTATMSKVRGGLGTIADHLLALFERHGGELRRHVKVTRIVTDGGAVRGVELGEGEVVTAPVVVSNLDPTQTFCHLLDPEALPEGFTQRVGAIDHRAAYFQAHFALRGLPEYRAPYEALNGTSWGRNVTFFGTAEEMQRDFEGCVRGEVPASPSFNLQIPSMDDPSLAPEACTRRRRSRSTFRGRRPGDAEPVPRRDGRAHRGQDRGGGAELPRPDRAAAELSRLHLRADVRLHRRRLLPWVAPAGIHGAVPARARGWPDNPVPVDGLYLCGAGCHGGPGVTFIPGYNAGYAVLEGADAADGGVSAGGS